MRHRFESCSWHQVSRVRFLYWLSFYGILYSMSNIKYTKEVLQPVIASSVTWADVCRKLGLKPATGSQSHIKNVAVRKGLDYSHFLGKSARKGTKTGPRRPIEEYLVKGSRINSSRLRERLINEGLKEPRCGRCGLVEWCDEDAPLELDHINSDHSDNQIDNLQILCANCHHQVTKQRRCSPTGRGTTLRT